MEGQEIIRQSQLNPWRHTWYSRIPFAIAALGGGAVLLGLKALGTEQLLVTGAATIFLVGYAAIVGLVPILRIREDQLADNCYYLGFLYTLFSLAWALQSFATSGDEKDIVANFGLALGSTIVGILLRVVINQGRKDVIETETDARMALAQAVIRLRTKIDDSVLALDSFCKQTEQIAADSIRASAERASGALEESVTKVGEASKGVLERIDVAFEEFTNHTSQLNAASSNTVKSVKALLTRVEKIEAPNDLISKRLEPAFQVMESIVARLNERTAREDQVMGDAVKRTTEITESLKVAVEGIALLGNQITKASEASLRASSAADQAAARFAALVASTEAAIQAHKRLANETLSSLDPLLATFRAHNEGMSAELARSQRMTGDIGKALADLADTVVDRVRATSLTPESHGARKTEA